MAVVHHAAWQQKAIPHRWAGFLQCCASFRAHHPAHQWGLSAQTWSQNILQMPRANGASDSNQFAPFCKCCVLWLPRDTSNTCSLISDSYKQGRRMLVAHVHWLCYPVRPAVCTPEASPVCEGIRVCKRKILFQRDLGDKDKWQDANSQCCK